MNPFFCSIDQTKAVIEDNIQFMSEAVSALASSTNESLSGIKSHLNNAISTVEAFQGIPEKAILLSNSITSMTNFESKLQSGIDVLKTGFLQSFSDCKAEYSSQVSFLSLYYSFLLVSVYVCLIYRLSSYIFSDSRGVAMCGTGHNWDGKVNRGNSITGCCGLWNSSGTCTGLEF